MGQELFRKAALHTLASPERLDELMVTTGRRSWIALCAVGLLLAAVIAWSILGSLPTSISGPGIIVRKGGNATIVANGNGPLTLVRVFRVGDEVHKGQLVGRISQPALELQVELARLELHALEAEAQAITAAVGAEGALFATASKEQQALQKQIVDMRRIQIASLQKVAQQQEELVRDGLITEQRLEESRQAILAAQNDIGATQSQFRQQSVHELESSGQRAERLRAVRVRIAQADSRYRALQLQLSLETGIVSDQDGLVVELMAADGDSLKSGAPVMRIESQEQVLEAVFYLPPGGGARTLEPGMAARVSPADARPERYGYLVGKVISVAHHPATEAGMMTIFNNPGLVREMSKAGPPLAVLVQLAPDSHTASGYLWSGGAGRDLKINSGTLASASFVTDRSRPIGLLLPMLREAVGL